MTTLSELLEAYPWLFSLWDREGLSEQDIGTLELARDAMSFISATGQRYRFEDFSSRKVEGSEARPHGTGGLRERLSNAERFFDSLRHEIQSPEEKAQLQAVQEAIRFIVLTDQAEALEAYLERVEANAPPFIVASFETRDEADAWLKTHPQPPDPARVLIAGKYHDVVYDRETGLRRLPWNRDLENYLAELRQQEPPVAVRSFATREDAMAWLEGQDRPAMRQWVSIAGEPYLAAYYPNIGHRALFPLALAGDQDSNPAGSKQE